MTDQKVPVEQADVKGSADTVSKIDGMTNAEIDTLTEPVEPRPCAYCGGSGTRCCEFGRDPR